MYTAGVTYAPHGGYSVLPYGNGLVQHAWYDSRLRPQTLRAALNDQPNNVYLQFNFGWNGNDTLGAVTDYHGGAGYPGFLTFTQSFGYDPLNRLSSATDTGGWSRSFQYDAYGNMWLAGNTGVPVQGSTPVANVYTGSSNRLAGGSYDGAGNQTVVNGNGVAYDAESRMVSVTAPENVGGGKETLGYDGVGQRVAKTMGGGTTVYVYDAFG